MRETTNECVDCGLPCMGSTCPHRNVTRFYCDKCGEETTIFLHEGKELCKECIFEELALEEVTE